MWQNYNFWPKTTIWDLKRNYGDCRSCPIFFKRYCECIFTMAKTKFRSSIFGLSHRLYRGSEVTVGSEDPLQNFLKDKFFQEGSSRTCFDHGQFEIKTFPIFMPHSNVQSVISSCRNGYHLKKKKFKLIICTSHIFLFFPTLGHPGHGQNFFSFLLSFPFLSFPMEFPPIEAHQQKML